MAAAQRKYGICSKRGGRKVTAAEDDTHSEDPVALAQAQVTFWKKWKPDGEEHKSALGKLKFAKAQALSAKSLEQQAQSLSDQLQVARQKLTAQKKEATELVHTIVGASEHHDKLVEDIEINTKEAQSLESQLHLAAQAAAYEAPKGEDLFTTLHGKLAARMPEGWEAPPQLRAKVSELAQLFDNKQYQHTKYVDTQAKGDGKGKGSQPAQEPDGFPAVGERADEPEAPQPIPGQHAPTPEDDKELEYAPLADAAEATPMDESQGRVRAAAALEPVANGMAKIQSDGEPRRPGRLQRPQRSQ
ncbi:unnamed protein product, partial [Prorocentrum cordatum]